MPRIGRNDPRKAYIAYWNEHLGEGTKAHGKEFDAWLDSVKAETLREAAQVWGDSTWSDTWFADGVDDDVSAVQSTVRWLRERADEVARSTIAPLSRRTEAEVKAEALREAAAQEAPAAVEARRWLLKRADELDPHA